MGIIILPIGVLWVLTEMLHICCFIIVLYESYWMGDLAILETFLQLIEQDVVNSKKAEKSENCSDNDY